MPQTLAPVATSTTLNVPIGSLPSSIDGVPIGQGTRVLLYGQTNPGSNGIWAIMGPAGFGRPDDANTWNELVDASVVILGGQNTGNVARSDAVDGGSIGATPVTWTVSRHRGARQIRIHDTFNVYAAGSESIANRHSEDNDPIPFYVGKQYSVRAAAAAAPNGPLVSLGSVRFQNSPAWHDGIRIYNKPNRTRNHGLKLTASWNADAPNDPGGASAFLALYVRCSKPPDFGYETDTFYRMITSRAGRVVLQKYVNAQWFNLVDHTPYSPRTLNTSYDIELGIIGQRLRGYINQSIVCDHTDLGAYYITGVNYCAFGVASGAVVPSNGVVIYVHEWEAWDYASPILMSPAG